MPPTASAAVARTGPAMPGIAGPASVTTANGSTARAAPRNCTAVAATGSRPASSRVCATVNIADTSREASTSTSPAVLAPPP